MKNLLCLAALALLLSAARSLLPEGGDAYGVAQTELAFGFVLLSAFLVSEVLALVGLPKLVGYILAGIAAGPHALNLLPSKMTAELDLVSGVAICLIALTAGGELSVRKIRPLLKTIGALTLWGVMGTTLVLTAALYALSPWLPFLQELDSNGRIAFSAMMGIALAAQSPAVVMGLLSETRAEGAYSRTILGTVVMADLLVILMFGAASAFARSALGGETSVQQTALGVAWQLFGSIGAGAILGLLLTVYLREIRDGALVFVTLLCIVVAELAVPVDLDPLIVMLASGLVMANLADREASNLVRDLETVSLPVYILFFATAGATLHLDVLAEVAAIVVVLVGLRGASFGIFSRIATRVTAAPAHVRRWGWAGMLPQAGLALALALLVQNEFGPEGAEASALLLGVIAVNELVMPILLRAALLRSGEAGMHGEERDSVPAERRAAT
jgi:Kef-type K+ transport system membrane component KefB